MPYSITTKDGITINNIPDGVDPNSPELKARVAEIRAGKTAKKEEPGFLSKVADVVTGESRKTKTTEALPDWAGMPELSDIMSVAGWKTGLGTIATSPEETVKVIRANFPGVRVRQDEKGNYILKSSKDGREYAIKPGFQLSDVPRIGSVIGAQMGIGRALGLPAAGLGQKVAAGAIESGLTQSAIEGTQAATGGTYDVKDVALATAAGGAVPLVGAALKPAAKAVKRAVAPAKPVAPKVESAIVPKPELMVQAADAIPAKPAEVAPIASQEVAAMAPQAQEELGTLLRKASTFGPGQKQAMNELAKMAKGNPEVMQAADDLGIKLPTDVVSDSMELQKAAGIMRGEEAGTAKADWDKSVIEVKNKIDEVLGGIGADRDISVISQQVKDNLDNLRNTKYEQAKALYGQIDEAVPGETRVNLSNIQSHLSDVLKKNPDTITTAEKELLELSTRPGGITYSDLSTIKSEIGAALRGIQKGKREYTSIPEARLKRINQALGADKLDAVNAVDETLGATLKEADALTAQQKALESDIIGAFGKEGEGSVASKIQAAVASASSKGDVKQLNAILGVVPDDLKKQAMLSAIIRQGSTGERFSFQKYASTYYGLRSQKEVWKKIAPLLTPEEDKLLNSAYKVSKRMAEAEQRIARTGKALEPLVRAMTAPNLVERVLGSTVGRVGASVAATKIGGPLAGVAAAGASQKVVKSQSEKMAKAAAMLESDDFARLARAMAEADTKQAQEKAIRRFAASGPVYNYVKTLGQKLDQKSREEWVREMMKATATRAAVEAKGEE